MSYALEIEDLSVSYGGAITGVDSASLVVPEGAVVALLGANGAGKTSILKAISGLLPFENGRITRGSVRIFGEEIGDLPAHKLAQRGVMHVREGRRVFAGMTIEENLMSGSFATPRGRSWQKQIDWVYDFFPILKERRHGRAGFLSGGEQQMLALGRALVAEPKLLLVDEASLGLSPIMAREIFRALGRVHAERGISVLIVEQNARLALAQSTHAYVLELGRTVMSGPAAEIAADPSIAARYLGGH